MKIEFRATGSAGAYTTLMDVTAGDTVDEWEPSWTQRGQFEDLASNVAQGNGIFTNTLGNIRSSIPLHNLNRVYASPDAAFAAANDLPSLLLNTKVNLKITVGGTVRYYRGCVCTAARPRIQGLNVVYNFDFTGSGAAQSSEPA